MLAGPLNLQAGSPLTVMAKAERAKDMLDPRAYLKLLRANIKDVEIDAFKSKDNEEILALYTDFFSDVASSTPRIKASTLKSAVMLCFDRVTAETAKDFANKASQAYQYVISKSKSYVTGARLSTSARSVVQVYLRNKARWEENQARGRSRAVKLRSAKKKSGATTAKAELIASTARKNVAVKEESPAEALDPSPMTTPPPRRRLFSDSPPQLPFKRRSTPDSPVTVSFRSMSPIPWSLQKLAEASPAASDITALASPVLRKPAAGSQANVRRPAAAQSMKQSVLRRPGAAETAGQIVLRKPAAAILKRPAAEPDAAVAKKPAAATRASRGPRKFGIFSEEEITDRENRGLPREIQQQYSQGCSKCRRRRGCTDACWKSRGYLLEKILLGKDEARPVLTEKVVADLRGKSLSVKRFETRRNVCARTLETAARVLFSL